MEPEGELDCDQLETLHSKAGKHDYIASCILKFALFLGALFSRSLLTGKILNHSPLYSFDNSNTEKLFAKLTSPVKLIDIAVHTSEIALYLPSLLQSKQ